jgi:hypothetical protein
VAHDDGLRTSIGLAARKTIVSSFSWTSTLAAIGDLYSAAIQGDHWIRQGQWSSKPGGLIKLFSRQPVLFKAREEVVFANFLAREGAMREAMVCYLRALVVSIADGPAQFLETAGCVLPAVTKLLTRAV